MNKHERLPDPLGQLSPPVAPLGLVETSERVWATLMLARDAGLEPVIEPQWSEPERAAFALYAPLLQVGEPAPYLFGQVGQSLCGRIATPDGDARDISSRDGLIHLHRCRALSDAVMIGAGTAMADDPRLTVRLAQGQNPARIVIDPNGRVEDDATVFEDDGSRRIVIQSCGRKRSTGIEVVELERSSEGIQPRAIADTLRSLGLRRVLVEGGADTIGRFLDAGLLRRLHVAIAPLIIGDGPAGLRKSAPRRLANAIRPSARVFALGGDILFDCSLDTAAG